MSRYGEMITRIPDDPDELSPVLVEGLNRRKLAERKFGEAARLRELAPDEAAVAIRKCLAIAASAFYWLEESAFEDEAHDDLHKYGRFAREEFADGCHLSWNGRSYEHRCPVEIAHKRLGFSIGFLGNRICSICGTDASECPHEQGAMYEVLGAKYHDGVCRVCGRDSCEDHVVGVPYRTRAAVRLTDLEIHEVSIVSKPKQPDARLTAVPYSTEALARFLGPGFRPGVRVSCEKCLDPCEGIEPLDLSLIHGEVEE